MHIIINNNKINDYKDELINIKNNNITFKTNCNHKITIKNCTTINLNIIVENNIHIELFIEGINNELNIKTNYLLKENSKLNISKFYFNKNVVEEELINLNGEKSIFNSNFSSISKANDGGANAEIAVKTTGLTKKYRRGEGEFAALSSVDLTIKRGEFVAIMGASGSGKSTLLHLIAGLTRPTSGSVEVEGKRIFDCGDRELTIFRRRRLGVVFQNYNLIPHLTAEENILFPLRADGRDVALTLEKMRKLASELDILQQLGQYPDSLSGGQQQRVALARGLCADPAILLADEPTGNLDWTSGQNVCRVLNKLNREEGRTIALVTHEPAVAAWARRVVVLLDGEIAADMSTSEFSDASALAARYQEIVRRDSLNV